MALRRWRETAVPVDRSAASDRATIVASESEVRSGAMRSSTRGCASDDLGRSDVPAHLPAFERKAGAPVAAEQLAIGARQQLAEPALVGRDEDDHARAFGRRKLASSS